ncbi:9644_t:CDS:2 [Gigaspora rosea]|nr:9644_t:CDS:2 [Gigaspora rosea]
MAGEKEETATNKDKSVKEGRTYREWLEAFVDYEETEDKPSQENGHVVEVEKRWRDEKQESREREYVELVQDPSDDEIDWEEYYQEEYYWNEHRRKERDSEVINLEEIYVVNDHWEIEAEERFLTATADHITKGNGWYEEEEFEPILDEGFARMIEYQDLIMDVVMESGVGYNWYGNDWETGEEPQHGEGAVCPIEEVSQPETYDWSPNTKGCWKT